MPKLNCGWIFIYLFIYLSIYLFVFNLFIVENFFQLKIRPTSTNSKTCHKPLARSTILRNVGIIDIRHLKQNLSLRY